MFFLQTLCSELGTSLFLFFLGPNFRVVTGSPGMRSLLRISPVSPQSSCFGFCRLGELQGALEEEEEAGVSVSGAAEPCHSSAGLPGWVDGGLSKPTWGAGVGPLSPELLKEQFVLQGLQPAWKERDSSTALEPAAAASCCQRAPRLRG